MFYAPLRVRVAPGRFREPDLVLLLDVNDSRNQNAFWLGADLVVEISAPTMSNVTQSSSALTTLQRAFLSTGSLTLKKRQSQY